MHELLKLDESGLLSDHDINSLYAIRIERLTHIDDEYFPARAGRT
ncbi:hypothetical protein ACO2Q9_04795 [Variovorax sp. VNK109]